MTSSYTYWHWQCADGSTASKMSGLRSRLAADLWSAAKRRRFGDKTWTECGPELCKQQTSVSQTVDRSHSEDGSQFECSVTWHFSWYTGYNLSTEKTRKQESSSKRLHRCLQRTQTHNTVHTKIRKNSSGDEIANVNFLCDDIVHALKYNRLLHKFRHRSFSATQVYQIQWNNAM